MSEFSLFWTTGATGDGASPYTMPQLTAWLRRTFTAGAAGEGILGGSGSLAVSGVASPVSVAVGGASVYGYPYETDTVVAVAIPTPVSATRIDRIVLRADWTAQTVRVTRVAGAEGGAAPSLTQTPGATYDIPLAQVSITTGGVITITDERVFCHFATRVAEANLDDSAVTTNKIAANAISDARLRDSIARSVIGRSANSAGDPADIQAASDGQVLRRSGDTIGFGQVATAGIANDAVDDTKVGNRVPQFIGRQGGNANNWSGYNTGGTVDYSPGGVRMQGGFVEIVVNSPVAFDSMDIYYPVAFAYAPLVYLSLNYVAPTEQYERTILLDSYQFATPQADRFSLGWQTVSGTPFVGTIGVNWLAIGPE